jgi:hypothetical protein
MVAEGISTDLLTIHHLRNHPTVVEMALHFPLTLVQEVLLLHKAPLAVVR